MKYKAVIRRFIVVSGRWNDRPGVFVTTTSHCFHFFSLSHIKSIKIVIFDNNNAIPDEQEVATFSPPRPIITTGTIRIRIRQNIKRLSKCYVINYYSF